MDRPNLSDRVNPDLPKVPQSIINEDINEILRGEISAVEAYEQVLNKVDELPESHILKDISVEHERAVKYWKKQSRDEGKIPETSSSTWGKVVASFVAVSKLLGKETALRALKQGEEYGLKQYEEMLESEELNSLQKIEIKNRFIPLQIKHLGKIDSLLFKH